MRTLLAALLAGLLAALFAGTASLRAEEVDVSAAASLQDALRTIAATYERRTGDHVVFNFGASSTLATQIRAGAPVDVFFSADEAKLDSVEIVSGTRRTLLSNTLVVVGNRPLRSPRDLVRMPRIAIAEPSSVPAGIYARQWLQRLGLWQEVLPHVIPTADVRAALAAVDGGNADAAIVYRTDALLAKHARMVFEVTGPNAPKIAYPVAIVRGPRHPAAARRFWEYLQSREAAAVFRRYGFPAA
jgi:molybdate transport system substrate-binding protein